MSAFDALLLGIIQGITEFLPISSTAHLTLAGRALGLIRADAPGEWTATIAVIQLGTAVSVLVYFRKDLAAMWSALAGDFGRRRSSGWSEWRPETRLALLIAAGTVPIVAAALLLKELIEGGLTKDPVVIAWSLILLALLLLAAEITGRRRREIGGTTLSDAMLVGTAQAVALVPGASRSGTTMTAGLFLGFTREAAARFSFLLSIPAVLLSGVFEMYQARELFMGVSLAPMALAVATSAVSGYLAIALLLRFLRTHSTGVFIAYRILLGAWILLAW